MTSAAAGAVVWALLVAVAPVAPRLELPLVEAVLLFAVLVLVPLGLPLTRPPQHRTERRTERRPVAERLQPAGAALAAAGVLTPRGTVAGLLAGGWLAVTLVALAPAAAAWLRAPTLRPVPLARTGALAFLVVGAAWLVVDRLGWQPLGLDRALVTLTAVHFHIAGFATSTIAARTAAVSVDPAPRLTALAVAGVVVGPATVAVGFAAYRPLQLAGAVVLTAGIYVLAWLLVRHVRVEPPAARGLLVGAAVVVVLPMALAVQWAAGAVLGTPALGVPAMARTHGLANAFGFALPALVAWHLARRDDAA